MRRIFLFIFLLFSLVASAQIIDGKYYTPIKPPYSYEDIVVLRSIAIRGDTLSSSPWNSFTIKAGQLYVKDSVAGKWVQIVGAGSGADSALFAPNYRIDTAKQNLRTSIAGKQNVLTTGNNAQYLRGDLTLATFPTIPPQFNPLQGPNIVIAGTYPNMSISAPDVTTLEDVKHQIADSLKKVIKIPIGGSLISTLIDGVDSLHLKGDSDAPGNSKLYGTSSSGVKGWYDQPTGGAGNTNIGSSPSSTTVTITSSTGTGTTLNAATSSLAGLMTAADKRRADTSTTIKNTRQGDTLAFATGPGADTLNIKGIELVAGANVTITPNHTQEKVSYTIAATGGGSGGATNLSLSKTASTNVVANDNGAGVTLSAATGSQAGLMTAADKLRSDTSTTIRNAAVSGDSLAYSSGPGADTLTFKRFEFAAGSNVTITPDHTLGKNKYTIAASGASWGGISGTLSTQTDLQSALNAKEGTLTAGSTAQYYRGDKSWQTLNAAAVGLGNVTNVNTANAANISSGTLPDGRLSSNVVLLTGTQTLTNKTLTSPAINVTSDATGDIYYRNASGLFTRLPIGTTGQILKVVSGIPAWSAAPTTSFSSGTYTPTITVQGNTGAGMSSYSCRYQQVGDVVTVSGRLTIQAGSEAADPILFDIDLPLSTTFTFSTDEASGVVTGGNPTRSGYIRAVPGTERVRFTVSNTAAGTVSDIHFVLSYYYVTP